MLPLPVLTPSNLPLAAPVVSFSSLSDRPHYSVRRLNYQRGALLSHLRSPLLQILHTSHSKELLYSSKIRISLQSQQSTALTRVLSKTPRGYRLRLDFRPSPKIPQSPSLPTFPSSGAPHHSPLTTPRLAIPFLRIPLHFFALFCTPQKSISRLFKQIHTLCRKTPGVNTQQTDLRASRRQPRPQPAIRRPSRSSSPPLFSRHSPLATSSRNTVQDSFLLSTVDCQLSAVSLPPFNCRLSTRFSPARCAMKLPPLPFRPSLARCTLWRSIQLR
jgi:hypothetical protein